MSLDFGKLNAGTGAKQTDPRKIFTTLKRDPRFKRPLDEQADVLDAWYARRQAKDLTIKMNTGGGKTVVGLLCLQSALNENVKPAVYITPDNFLVNQVLQEAKALGIPATDDEKAPDFLAGRAILVANVWKLFNARSVFGVGQKKIPGSPQKTENGVLSRNRRNFRHPSSSPATSASRSIILPSLWKV